MDTKKLRINSTLLYYKFPPVNALNAAFLIVFPAIILLLDWSLLEYSVCEIDEPVVHEDNVREKKLIIHTIPIIILKFIALSFKLLGF